MCGSLLMSELYQLWIRRLLEPLARNLHLDATDADRAPDRLAFLARDVLMVFQKVE
jgi:hypothetical protein